LVAEADREEIPKVLRESGYLAALERGRKSGLATVICKADMESGGIGRVLEIDVPVAIARLSHGQKIAAEEFGMIVGLIPCVLSLATRIARGDAEGILQAESQQLVTACRTIGAASLAPERWELMAEMIERAYVRGLAPDEMAEWSKTVSEGQADSFNILVRLVACANASPTEAAAAMLSIMPRLCRCMPPGTVAHRVYLERN
jgi:hypothetical protein